MSPQKKVFPLVVAVALCVSLSSCGSERFEGSARPSLLLIVVDTLRADGLDPEGLRGGTTPHIARLADERTQFTSAVAVSPWTGPSVSSIVTGKYPIELGIYDLRDPLPDTVPNLAQRLAAAGYATSAVISNGIAGPAYGHDRGYEDFYFEPYKVKPETGDGFRIPSFTADRVTEKALEWLNGYLRVADDLSPPFFLHVHYTDPHDPYFAPETWRTKLQNGQEPLSDSYLLGAEFVRNAPTPVQLEAIKASYRAEVAFADHEIGRLLERVPAGTAVILTSDHGEEFFEHGGFLHGHTLYEELVHVPLIIRGPGVPPGVTVRDTVSHVDITPTVLDLTGIGGTDSDGFSGTSLLRYVGRPFEREGPIYSILESHRRLQISVRRDEWKLHMFPNRRATLANLRDDPDEAQDFSQSHPEIASELLRLGQDWQRQAVERPDDEADRERLEALRSIGYIGGR